MATEQNFSIRKGRTCTITVDIVGVSVWTDIVAKLFADYDIEASDPILQVTGTIDPVLNKATFTIVSDDTNELDAQTSLRYEVVLYKTDGSYVKDSNYGLLNIAPAVKIDPTT